MLKKSKSKRYFGMTGLQAGVILLLSVLLLSITVVFFAFITLDNPAMQPQLQPKTPTPPTISANISISTEKMADNTVLVTGKTNLPDGTIIMVSIEGLNSDFLAQDRVVVSSGKYQAGPFGPSGIGLNGGKYTAKALMPYPAVQPESVRKIIGNDGERLTGNQVIFDNGVLVVTTKVFEIIIPTPSPLPRPTSTPTPIKIVLSGGDIGRGWFNDDRRISLISVYRTETLGGNKPFGDWNGGYEAGFTQFLVIELQFDRFTPGFDEYEMSGFWLWAYTDDGYREYQADQYLYEASNIIRVNYQDSLRQIIAFEVTPDSHNFIMCYHFGIAVAPSGKIVSECGSTGYQFKFGD